MIDLHTTKSKEDIDDILAGRPTKEMVKLRDRPPVKVRVKTLPYEDHDERCKSYAERMYNEQTKAYPCYVSVNRFGQTVFTLQSKMNGI